MKKTNNPNGSFKRFTLLTALAAAMAASGVSAGVIDFESGFKDGQVAGTVTVAGVDVTFGTIGSGGGDAYIAAVGGNVTGFAPRDTPANGVAGQYFLSDDNTGLKLRNDYSIRFSEEVAAVSLDAYDYRADGGARKGDTVTLYAFDAMNQLIGSDVYTITGKEPDANVVSFGVRAEGIRTVSLAHSRSDVGAGIDNIRFETTDGKGVAVAAAPEPGEWAMIGLGGLVFGILGVRRRASDEAGSTQVERAR